MRAKSNPITPALIQVAERQSRVTIGLLVAGMLVFLAVSDFRSHPQYIWAAAVMGASFIPGVRGYVSAGLARVREPSGRMKWITAGFIAVLCFRYFLWSASVAGHELFPRFHDEHMFLLQARMMSRGRLWMPPHELGDFFDSFYVVTKPVYGIPYFPGTALAYVPGIWLGLQSWATSATIAGLMIAMTYLAVTEIQNGVAGLAAALFMLSLEQVRKMAVMTMSNMLLMLLGVVMLWVFWRWNKSRRLMWIAALGACFGWAGITRPLDALCFAIPISLGMVWILFHWEVKPGRKLMCCGTAVLAALPFLGLQLLLDRGMTGKWLGLPISEYARANLPALDFGFYLRNLQGGSHAHLAQIRDYYEQFFRHDLESHGRIGFAQTFITRWANVVRVCLPGNLLLVLLPLGLMRVFRNLRIIACGIVLLLILAYTFYPSYLLHYGVPAAIGFFVIIAAGVEGVERAHWRPAYANACWVGLMAIAIGSLPEIRRVPDRFMDAPYLADINAKLAHLEHVPAVVLFHYESGRSDVHEEPVYNLDVAWPDDAPVIRAQDLGEENGRIFRYYAEHQPRRFFYRYDRTNGVLTELGTAKDLAGAK
jgi:hypothetical protein